MKYQILHENAHSLRVRRTGRGFSMGEAETLKAQLAVSGSVRTSRIYPATGGIRLEYTCTRPEILAFLDRLEPVSLEAAPKKTVSEKAVPEKAVPEMAGNVMSGGAITASAGGLANVIITPFPLRDMAEEAVKEEAKGRVSREELKQRKMDPKLKNRLRRRIILEAGADLVLPAPVQLAYHLYQLVTLKEL